MQSRFPTPVLQRAFQEKLPFKNPCALSVLQINPAGRVLARYDIDSVPNEGVFFGGGGLYKKDAPQDIKLRDASKVCKNALELYYECNENRDYFYIFSGETCDREIAVFDQTKPTGETRLLGQSFDIDATVGTLCRIGDDVFLVFRLYPGNEGGVCP